MKKIAFLFITIVVLSLSAKSQNNDTVFNDYFFPNYITEDFCTTPYYLDINNSAYHYLNRGHHYFVIEGYWDWYDWYSYVLDRAQPCFTDTLLTIKGVAVGINYLYYPISNFLSPPQELYFPSFQKVEMITPLVRILEVIGVEAMADSVRRHYNNIEKGKLKIMNGTMEHEIASVDIDTNFNLIASLDYTFLEFYFDNPVNVNGLFYIVEDILPKSTRLLKVIFTKDCYSEYPSLVRTATDSTSANWMHWSEHSYNNTQENNGYSIMGSYTYYDLILDETNGYYYSYTLPIPNTCQMFIFPIFAETDSTLGDGVNFDMSLYNATVDRYSNVYPNPAKDIVTVQSSFKVKEIEIHNALGQVVLRKQGSQNIETIDVSNLQSGAYIVRIKTQRGFANKKILIE